ncbi:MAG: lysylphosphatidylglycerol synthase transmembrane domain-containing protein, partial [Planctomycetota bacterium]|nr:lysylphosphatidylglycerol synthase transmembrane domain-containing protein [Planctomycetota bacterium]
MSQQTAPTNSRRWIIRLLKLLVLLIVLWAGHRTISRGIEEFEQNGHRLDQIEPQWLLLSAGIYLFSQLPCGLFWRRILLSMGQRVTTWRTLRAYYIGHLGKYVPGKAMVVLLRAGLIRGPGVETGPVVAAIFYETLSTMAIGSLLGTVLLFFLDPIPWKIVLIGLGMSLGTGLPTVPLVFNVLLHVLRKDRDKEAAQSSINGESKEIEPAAKLTFRKLAPGWPGLVIGWILAGLSLWACTRAMFPDAPGPAEGLVLYISAVTLSVVAGFVSMLPGGVGVREVVLLT